MDTNNNKSQWQEREVCALWARKSANGDLYYTGKIKLDQPFQGVMSVVGFKNKNATSENGQPILYLYVSTPANKKSQVDDLVPALDGEASPKVESKPAPKKERPPGQVSLAAATKPVVKQPVTTKAVENNNAPDEGMIV